MNINTKIVTVQTTKRQRKRLGLYFKDDIIELGADAVGREFYEFHPLENDEGEFTPVIAKLRILSVDQPSYFFTVDGQYLDAHSDGRDFVPEQMYFSLPSDIFNSVFFDSWNIVQEWIDIVKKMDISEMNSEEIYSKVVRKLLKEQQ